MSDHHLAKGLSLSLVHDFGIHYLLIPEIRILYQLSVPGSKHTSSKLHSLPRLFPIYPDCHFDSCYSHFMPHRMTPSVRHRAIEVHYYYYYYYYYRESSFAKWWSDIWNRKNKWIRSSCWNGMWRKLKTIVNICRLLICKCFVYEKTEFVIDSLFDRKCSFWVLVWCVDIMKCL